MELISALPWIALGAGIIIGESITVGAQMKMSSQLASVKLQAQLAQVPRYMDII